MDRKGRPRSPGANPAKLRHPHDGIAWTAVEWRGSARLSADRIRLYAGCAAQLPDGEGVTLNVCAIHVIEDFRGHRAVKLFQMPQRSRAIFNVPAQVLCAL